MKQEPTLSETAFRIYLFFLKNNPREVTRAQIQEQFDLSKSVILHHLKKLIARDLVEEAGLGYKLKRFEPIGPLRAYLYIHSLLIPRALIHIILYSFGLIIISGMGGILSTPQPLRWLGWIASIIGIAYSMYNVFKTLNVKDKTALYPL